ncbi:hypothetical protein CBS101457_005829 [Exobasidium rhododendri]|nr:hypothetical protein CBS101457_005829 [Exobasidium rhododendri]
MSRRAPSDVRGPTSALTSFLRDKNIRVPNLNRFRRRQNGDEATAGPEGVEGASNESAVATSSAAPVPASSSTATAQLPRAIPRRRMTASASMQFEEDEASEEEGEKMTTNGNKRTNEDDLNEVSSSAKRIKHDDISADTSQSAAGSTSTAIRRNPSYRHTTAGSIDFCAMCASKFTVTAYTKHTPDGGLCHKCGPKYAGGEGPRTARDSFGQNGVAGPSAVKKKAAPRRKFNRPIHEFSALPSLQSLCINIVATCIEDVEALIGIGGQNMDAISKSISKNRRLNNQTVQLFLQPQAKKLAFYDCSQIESSALASIPTFSPYIEEINLQLCGMLDNDAMDAWTTKLKKLHRLELYGCFLVRVEAWHRFFETIGDRLTSFKIRESPRFDRSCCESLVKNCPNVTELGLAQIGPLNADCLALLEQYGDRLTYLDISDPGVSAPGIPAKSLEDDEVIRLLCKTGRCLSFLDLSRNADLTSRTLLEGILENCKSLTTLRLTSCGTEGIEASSFIELFQGLKKRGSAAMTAISLERCLKVDDAVIRALIEFSGKTLVDLNINSCDAITQEGFQMIAQGCPNLKKIDVGFCRSVTDSFVIDAINNMNSLKEIWLFSCNKISDTLNSDKVRIIGKEKYITV